VRIVRYGLVAGAAIFGLLVAARAILGPLSFPVPVRTPINIESFCGLCLMLVLAVRMGGDLPASSKESGISPIYVAALGLLVAAAFWRAIGIYFLADDFVLIQFANHFRLGDVRTWLTTPEGNAFFRPVLHFFMALTATWAKFDPRLWHAASLILHALNSVLVMVLAARLGLSRNAAFFAGALFAIHGSLPESVVWIAGEYGMLSTFFVLCGLLALLAHLRDGSRRRWLYGAASIGCMVLAFITKESAYVFPLVAWLLVVSKRIPLRKAALILFLFLLVAMALFMYRWSLLGGIGGYRDDNSGVRLFAEVGVVQVVRSLLLRLWAVLYFPINWSRQPGVVLGVASAAYVVALVWMGSWINKLRTSRLPLIFPLGFLCLAALPPIQQLLIGADLQKSRALYLSSVGFALMLATAMEPLGRGARWLVPSAILLFHFAALQHNLSAWKSTGDIAKRACIAAAQCALPHGARPARPSVWNMPGSLDGVYFLGVGFNECVRMQTQASVPEAEFHSGDPTLDQGNTALLLWDDMNSGLSCVREGSK
jgi:hypothetical protein